MPIGEIETHPYLIQGQINGATKMILGSFPVYECTDNDSMRKQQKRQIKGTVRFFYGSSRSSLWAKYRQYVDNQILRPWDNNQILESLRARQISITDTITSCERYIYKSDKKSGERILDSFSSEDSALKNKNWNRDIVRTLINAGVTKILCTSKGVLSDLEKHIICFGGNNYGRKDSQLTTTFQTQFIERIGGNMEQITNDIAKVFIVGDRKVIALAIPSPGSPQRQIHTFGCETNRKLDYAENYFHHAFDWFKDE